MSGKHWCCEDIKQVFAMEEWLSMQQGYTQNQARTHAKYEVNLYKRKQLKHHFRKTCNNCGKEISFTTTACYICGYNRFTSVPKRQYPETIPDKPGLFPDPGDVAVGHIELVQFRAFITPYLSGRYDLYLFEAMLDKQPVAEIARTFEVHRSAFQYRINRIRRLYKNFCNGEEPSDADKTLKISKTAFVYRKGKAPLRLPTRLLVSGRSAYVGPNQTRHTAVRSPMNGS